MRKSLLAPAILLSLSALSHAASFDCAKAATAQEKAICATPALSTADEQMAAAYKAWLSAAAPDAAAAIRQNQLVWLRTRNTDCPAGDSSNPVAPCLTNIYKLRIDELHHMVQHLGGITFVSQAITLTVHDTPDTAPPAGIPEVTPGFGTFQATWPQATSPTPQWTTWNNAVIPAVIQVANADQSSSAKDWNGLLQPGADRDITVTVERANAQWVAAAIDDFYDGHGAHPAENNAEFYWMLTEQRALQPTDVFQPNSGWDTSIEKRLDAYLHQTLDAQSSGNYQSWFTQGDAAKTLAAIVTNPGDWKLEPEGLSLFFQPYQVACYACTPPDLVISWSDLKPYLQPSFVLPQ